MRKIEIFEDAWDEMTARLRELEIERDTYRDLLNEFVDFAKDWASRAEVKDT